MKRLDTLKWFVYYPALAFVLISTAIGLFYIGKESLTPVKMFESPLRAGNRVYMLTGQWRTKVGVLSNRSTPADVIRTTDLLVDMWCLDGKTAATIWRKRLLTERNGAMYDRILLGAQGDTIWVGLPSGLLAVSMADGTIRANSASLQERNPALKGLMPTETRQYAFDSEGLLMTAADARLWRFDERDLVARPGRAAERKEAVAPGVVRRVYSTPSSPTSFIHRSLNIPGHWLGVLNATEREMLETKNVVGGIDAVTRRALYGARTVEDTNFFGKFLKYRDFKQLGDEYLGPGLLMERLDGGGERVLWLRNPDSVLVLHRDRLGEEGRLRLTRIAGPEGRVVWDAALPLSVLQTVLAGEGWVSLYGVEFTPKKGNEIRDPMHSAMERLIAIDVATGKLGVHDQHDLASHAEAKPENQP